MRHATLLVPLSLVLLAAAPAPQDQTALQANLQQKLKKKFVESGHWRLDYDAARAEAAKEKKLIFVYFTRTFAP